ncbi:hypothetical protein Hte_007678 [Hypoxylon texense]
MATGPAYGRRLVPRVLDDLAGKDPHRVYAAIPKTSDVNDGYHDISVADLARCVDFMAKWLEDKFGTSSNFETITYIGPSDLRGPATLLAAIKTGYKLLLPSPRNPPLTNLSLMSQTGSNKVLYASELVPLAKSLQSVATSVSIDPIPSFQEMLDSNPEPYPYEKNFDEAKDDPIVVLHSSGSTGSPKPIPWTHGSIAAHDNDHNLPAPAGRGKMDSTVFNLLGEGRLYIMMPFFHLGGLVFYLSHAILNTLTLVLGPPHVPPDAALFKDIARQIKLRGMMAVPALLEELIHDLAGVELLKDLEFVSCAGAPLSTAAGDQIKDMVKLIIFIGSTETFPLPELSKSPDDWEYHEFNPNFKHEMQLFDPDIGTYELVIFADESNKDAAPLYHNLPGINPYYTKDLFTRHPTKPQLFKYYGRKDDILVLDNGEKVNPIPLEQYVQGHPAVKGALVVGNGRIQPALLVEPREPLLDESERRNFLKMLWPRIKESNAYVPGQGRITQDKIFCALPDKPFIRAGKGTIIRKSTEAAYQGEIEQLYSNASSRDQGQMLSIGLEPTLKAFYERTKITNYLRQITSVSFVPAATIGENEDLFAHGLDSLQTLEIVANLKRNLQGLTSNPVSWISPRIIFRNSTLADLSSLLAKFLNDGVVPSENSRTYQSIAVDEAVARHVANLPRKRATPPSMNTETQVVAVIGSTGYLGSYFVATLLRDPKVSQVYCLNRSSDAQERQTKTLESLDKTLTASFSKLTYLEIELGSPLLGLSQEKYGLLANEVDVIVYNSWRLDFGLAIRSFEPFLKATRDLVELSVASKRNMRVVFISSMASVGELATVPEAPVEDALASLNTGYGQSKLAAERILVTANCQSGIPVSVIRIGQVGGPSRNVAGTWADQPWISALIQTSIALGYFPTPVTPVDWVAVDTVADMLRSFTLRPAEEEPQIFNVTVPSEKEQPWDLVLDALRELEGTPDMETITLRDWIKKLREIPDSGPQDATKMPALKLLDFYETLDSGTGFPTYATERAREVSGVEIPAVDKELLVSWLKSWNL